MISSKTFLLLAALACSAALADKPTPANSKELDDGAKVATSAEKISRCQFYGTPFFGRFRAKFYPGMEFDP
jgi:hypothetical protein